MSQRIWLGAMVLAAVVSAQAATNDLAAALQKGLFEEEANRNLDAAIQAYQSVANQFDKDRKLAATAIFRLGECYRKQGNTNGAVTQFERVVREFADQSALVTLSRQNLASFGTGATTEVGNPATDFNRRLAEITDGQEIQRLQALIKDSPDLINATGDPSSGGMTPLQRAAEAGQSGVAQFLLTNGADTEVKSTARGKRTALHFAAAAGQKAMVELLLSNKANVQAVDENGLTPLHLVAEKGYRSVAESLLEHGAPVDATDHDGSTPFLVAASRGFKSVMELLLAHGANLNATTHHVRDTSLKGTALCIAAERGDQALAEFLVSKGAQVNVADDDGRTALSYAAEKPDGPMVKLLLEAHANPNAGTLDLPLSRAAYTGDLKMLKQLLAAGADPNTNSRVNWTVSTSRTSYGQGGPFSPLLLAVCQQHAEAVAELLHAKADPNSSGPQGEAPVFEALRDASTLEALLEGGANPNLRSANRSTPPPGDPQTQPETPLQRAVNLDSAHAEKAVELLLAHGAEPNVSFRNGWTPLHEATRRRDTNVMALLLQKGAAVNARQSDGYTPLHVAIELGKREAVKLLLENKADPNARDNAGQTLLDYAKSRLQTSGLPGFSTVPRTILPRPLRVPSGIQVTPAPGATAPSANEASPAAVIVDLLRQYGALDDLPRLDAIEVRRPAANYSEAVFTGAKQSGNRFTLAEVVGEQYALLNGSPGDSRQKNSYGELGKYGFQGTLPYPDLAHVHLRQPAPDSKSWQERTVDLSPLLEHGICTNDVALSWGEVVEIPEQDHPLDKTWDGFTKAQMEHLVKCLQRQVEVIVKGQATQVTFGPKIVPAAYPMPGVRIQGRLDGGAEVKKGTLWLKPALLDSGLVLASSDLSRVKVTRRDPAAGQRQEWVVDCSVSSSGPDLWLQEGDVIEVPEKGQD